MLAGKVSGLHTDKDAVGNCVRRGVPLAAAPILCSYGVGVVALHTTEGEQLEKVFFKFLL